MKNLSDNTAGENTCLLYTSVLGCDLRNIQMMFLLEAGYIGLIGGAVGLVFSYGISVVINRVVQSMGNMMTLSYIPPWLALLSLVFAILVGMVAGFFPSLRAMRLSPVSYTHLVSL